MKNLTKKQAIGFIAVLGILCIGLGVASGMAIERRYAPRYFHGIGRGHFMENYPGVGGFMHRDREKGSFQKEGFKAKGAGKVCERIGRQLDLTSEQKEKVEAILEGSRQDVTKARDTFQAELKKIKENSNTQILGVLNPEQKEKFQEMNSMIEQRKSGTGRMYRMKGE